MDTSNDEEINKRSFECDKTVLSNLNIINNTSNITILWNKFQIFIYENSSFETATKILFPDFQIYDLIVSGNYLVCLDYSGNVHTTPLKFKNSAQRSVKFTFQPRECNIVASSVYDEDHILCLKYESDSYFCSLHRTNSDFPMQKKVILVSNDHLPLVQTKDKYIVRAQLVTDNYIENIKEVFNKEVFIARNIYKFIVMTLDKLNIFGCIFNSKMTEEHVTLYKLYSCPSEICDIQVTEAGDLNIGLTIGTLLILSLKELQTPKIIHLNTAIHKYLVLNESVIYTDGISMWMAQNILCKEIKFIQYFVKYVKDFIMCRDQMICTTFTNLIYIFPISNQISYVENISNHEYCMSTKLFNNSYCTQKILEEVKINDRLIKTLTKEKNYITALSISNRQDIMDNIVKEKVIVYENYQDAITENTNLILTNNFTEYFDPESFFFMIKITTTTDHRLGDILSNSLGDVRIHLTLTTKQKLLKTISIKVTEPIKIISFLVPLKSKMIDMTEVNVNIKIVCRIPGALDVKNKIWTVLYRKNVKLHSEHFIKFNLSLNKLVCLKTQQDTLDELILQTARNNHGDLFEFTDILKQKPLSKEWKMYVRLPEQYREVFRNKDIYEKHLNSKKVNFFLQQFTSEDFLRSKSNLIFNIGNEKVQIEIYNDGFSKPLLKILSENIKIALNMRNFLSDLIYYVFANFGPGKEFINLSTYSTVENLQKAVRNCISDSSQEEVEPLIEKFERDIIGVLPI